MLHGSTRIAGTKPAAHGAVTGPAAACSQAVLSGGVTQPPVAPSQLKRRSLKRDAAVCASASWNFYNIFSMVSFNIIPPACQLRQKLIPPLATPTRSVIRINRIKSLNVSLFTLIHVTRNTRQ